MKKKNKEKKWHASVKKSVFCMAACLTLAGLAKPWDVHAAVLGEDMKQGNILELQSGDWKEDYVVLNPTETNVGTSGTFVMLNGYYDKIMFDEKGKSNAWEGSSAQKYCTEYYRKLPVTVKDRVIGVRTTDTESGSAWLDVSNIDGTKTDKDKVFFLSFKEYDAYRTGANLSSGYKWLLRCPGTDCSEYHDYIGVVDNDGSIHNYSIEHLIAARPGFNLQLPSDICAVKTEKDGVTVWKADADKLGHTYGAPVYEWSKDNRGCTGTIRCEICGESIVEKATVFVTSEKKPTAKENGMDAYTATFPDERFQTQVKNISIEKLPSKTETKSKKITAGAKYTIAGSVYKVLSPKAKTVSIVKAKNEKSYTISSTVKIQGKTFKVTQIEAKAFKDSKIVKVTIGKNVKVLKPKAFAGSKVTKVILKTKNLKKSTIKNCMKSSKVKTIQVKVGTKKENKKILKAYKKFFKKSVLGRSVRLF